MVSENKSANHTCSAPKTLNSSSIVRWYILTLPAGHRGSVKGLEAEQKWRKFNNQEPLEIFAPTYVEMIQRNGKWMKVDRPLLLNYVFIHASENEIYSMMRQNLNLFSFLPRVKNGSDDHYPYISDAVLENLKWIARSYSDILPVYTPASKKLVKGDRIRITDGRFKGMEALVLHQTGSGTKNVVVQIENWMCVPLMEVQAGQYEIIELTGDSKRIHAKLDNTRLSDKLHQALYRFHKGKLTDEDGRVANQTLREYGGLRMNGDAAGKLYALLLPAYLLLSDKESYNRIFLEMRRLLENNLSLPLRALLLVTIYGCTDNFFYYRQAHELIDPWLLETDLKKRKLLLIQRIQDYDAWFGHR